MPAGADLPLLEGAAPVDYARPADFAAPSGYGVRCRDSRRRADCSCEEVHLSACALSQRCSEELCLSPWCRARRRALGQSQPHPAAARRGLKAITGGK